MARAGIERLVLEAKEGLALSNGIDFMAAAGALAVHDAENLLAHAQIGAALSFEALLGLTSAFDPDLQDAGGQPGQRAVAARLLELVRGSRLADSDAGARAGRVQPALHAAGVGAGRRRAGVRGRAVQRRHQRGHRQPADLPGRRGRLPGDLGRQLPRPGAGDVARHARHRAWPRPPTSPSAGCSAC